MNIPNYLTISRILLIPVFITAFFLPYWWHNYLTASLFFLAGLTDYFDGYLARKWGQTSNFGGFLDPVADKLMVVASLIMLVGEYGAIWMTLPAIIIIGREITISSLREWMAEMGQSGKVKVSSIAKIKTFFQMMSIFLLLSQPADINNLVIQIGLGCMYIAVFLTLWSMCSYIIAARKVLFAEF